MNGNGVVPMFWLQRPDTYLADTQSGRFRLSEIQDPQPCVNFRHSRRVSVTIVQLCRALLASRSASGVIIENSEKQ